MKTMRKGPNEIAETRRASDQEKLLRQVCELAVESILRGYGGFPPKLADMCAKRDAELVLAEPRLFLDVEEAETVWKRVLEISEDREKIERARKLALDRNVHDVRSACAARLCELLEEGGAPGLSSAKTKHADAELARGRYHVALELAKEAEKLARGDKGLRYDALRTQLGALFDQNARNKADHFPIEEFSRVSEELLKLKWYDPRFMLLVVTFDVAKAIMTVGTRFK